SYVAIHISLILGVGVLVTGAIWAKSSWGVWWLWDEPTLVSFLIVFLLYGTYTPMRFAIEDRERQARYASVFAITAGAFVPICFGAVRAQPQEVHPQTFGSGDLPGPMWLTFLVCLAGMALLFYLIAPVVGLLGPGVMSVRLVSALAGGLTPLALWWAARPLVGPRAAVAAAGLLSWASWSLSMSRWAFPATLDQLLTLAALGLVWRALGDRPAGDARPAAAGRRPLAALALAGALGGLAAYTYHTGRLAPLVLAALAALWLGRDRFGWRRALPGLAAAVVAGALVLAPLLRFVAEDFQGYNRRTGAVAFYNEQDAGVHAPLLLLLRNGERYLLMWHVAGERNGRHHAPGAPMLDPLSGALFAAGLLLAALAWRQRPGRILLAWLALGLLPGLLSTGAPHAMRALPSLAPACALAAWGLDRLLHSAQGARRSATLAAAASALLLAASLALNAWLYFGRMPRDPQVLAAFDVPETAMGRVVREAAADPALRDVDVFLPASVRRSDVIRFLTSGARVGYFDITTGFSAEPGEQALLLLPAGAPAETQAAALEALGPGARALTPVPRDPGGRPLLLAFGRGAGAEALLRSTFR
ncbi:MAG: cytochrome c biogenesis protein CcsA, partial [Chloroflexota bacterium]